MLLFYLILYFAALFGLFGLLYWVWNKSSTYIFEHFQYPDFNHIVLFLFFVVVIVTILLVSSEFIR